MKLFFASENRFLRDEERKAWFEYLMAEIFNQSLALLPVKKMPVVFRQLQKAANNVPSSGTKHANAAKKIAKAVIVGLTCEAKQKEEIIKAMVAIVFTAAAEMVNHCNYFTVGYQNQYLGVACQNLLADTRRRTTASNFESLQYDNFTMIGDIARSFCNNEEIEILAKF